MQFSKKDLEQFEQMGIDPQKVEYQIQCFKKGFPFIRMNRAATVHDGIIKFKREKIYDYKLFFESYSEDKKVVKFVPASGAASRMFKDLFNFVKTKDPDHPMADLIENYKDFAFSGDIDKFLISKEVDPGNALSLINKIKIAKFILEEFGLNYGNIPKGAIQFHKYEYTTRTAFEEHLVEGASYSRDRERIVRIHFTVSEEHLESIKTMIVKKIPKYEERYFVKYNVNFTTQKKTTDTIAVDSDNAPFRLEDGSILFRPSGHGALIENLNDIDADIAIVKNIDNIVPDSIKSETVLYKKALAGYLFKMQLKIHQYLALMDNNPDSELVEEVFLFAKEHFGFNGNEEKDELHNFLNRPIRVCGMVKNEGEPGGGPFWVEDKNGQISLQIVESAQINLKDPEQKEIWENATHFNPVDLVCGLRDYKGQKFNLLNFVDQTTGFISNKSKEGKDLKSLELPGLWNGAMAKWLTIFIEVPLITFNPVKTVKDLLRREHQSIETH